MRIACIDDHKDDVEAAKKIIEEFEDIEADYFYDTTSIVENCQKYDAILMDIDVPVDNGLITAKKLREKEYDHPIVFMSWHFGFEHESFAVHPFCFIKKENLAYEMNNCFHDLLKEYHRNQDVFKFRNIKEEDILLRTRDILYFERQKNYVAVYIKDGTVEYVKSTLKDIMKRDAYGFHIIDKSIIINFFHVEKHPEKEIYCMVGGKNLYASRSKRDALHKEYLKFRAR